MLRFTSARLLNLWWKISKKAITTQEILVTSMAAKAQPFKPKYTIEVGRSSEALQLTPVLSAQNFAIDPISG